ncbi:hypothetical protein HZC21_04325 [Candidatus Peregrinibacteria bacterium]|nr:hypothetical protein [Candidatus Peregrinibacteria bacterium]
MHFKPHGFGLASAVLTAIGYGLCSLLYALWPKQSLEFMNYTSHNFDFSLIAGEGLTWPSFFAGLVVWVVVAYILGALFAWFYNQFAK